MSAPEEPLVLTERRGAVLLITLNRPKARNAISGGVAQGLEAAIDLLEGDDTLTCGVLRGAGKIFCAGADLRAIAEGNVASLSTEKGGFAGLVQRKRTKPLIASVHSAAFAGGFEIMLACDFIVAAEGAKYGLPEVQRSLVALAGGLTELPRLVGEKLALEMALLGDAIPVERLQSAGLIARVVPADACLDAALAIAARIAKNGPLAVKAARQIITEGRDLNAADRWALAAKVGWPVFASEDAKEGPQAFLEKRAPEWKGR